MEQQSIISDPSSRELSVAPSTAPSHIFYCPAARDQADITGVRT